MKSQTLNTNKNAKNERLRVRSMGRRLRGSLLAVLLAAILPGKMALAVEYTLGAGDVLALNVIGIPELKRDVPVDITGDATFPLIGEIHVAGRTLGDVRRDVVNALTSQPFRRQAFENHEATILDIAAREVSVEIANYKPVFVYGEVGKAGAVPFQPGMTVRQAVAVAGGFGRDASGNSGMRSQMKAQRDQSIVEYMKYKFDVRRLKGELGIPLGPDDAIGEESTASESGTTLSSVEDQRREVDEQDYQSKHADLVDAIAQASQRVASLASQADIEQSGAEQDAAEAAKVDELFKKGLVQEARESEVRRSSLLSSSRALQIKSAKDDAIRLRSELKSRLDNLEHEHKSQLLQQLSEALGNARKARLIAQDLGDGLADDSDFGIDMHIFIFRNRGSSEQRIAADEASELFPGDSVEVVFSHPTIPGATAKGATAKQEPAIKTAK